MQPVARLETFVHYYGLEGGRGIKVVTRGEVEGRELVRANGRFIRDHPDLWSSAEYWFSDYRDMQGTRTRAQDAHANARLTTPAAKERFVIGTVVSTDLAWGLTRMWQAMADRQGWAFVLGRDVGEVRREMERMVGRSLALDDGELLAEFEGHAV